MLTVNSYYVSKATDYGLNSFDIKLLLLFTFNVWQVPLKLRTNSKDIGTPG